MAVVQDVTMNGGELLATVKHSKMLLEREYVCRL